MSEVILTARNGAPIARFTHEGRGHTLTIYARPGVMLTDFSYANFLTQESMRAFGEALIAAADAFGFET